MPLKPNVLERIIFLDAHLGPGPMLDLFAPLAFKAVVAGLELGLFEALEEAPLTPTELAGRLDADARGLRFLLEALEPLGYVEEQEGSYGNTAMTKKWLVDGGETSLGELFLYFDDVVERWGHLAEAVRRGRPVADGASWNDEDPERWDRYHAGMLGTAQLLSKEVLDRVELPPTARRLLDLGGSHGYHAARFCHRHPALEATVFDLEPARAVAERTLDAEGAADRVAFRAGDFMADDLGQGWDVVLMFNVVRALPRESVADLFERVAGAMAPGGLAVVVDQLVARPRSSLIRANARLIDLELFASSPGDVYRADEVERWLSEAGLAVRQSFALRRSSGQGVITATL